MNKDNKVIQIDKEKNESNKSKQSVNIVNKMFNSLNNRNKVIGIMSLFVLTISLTALLTGKSFAETSGNGWTWGGCVTDSTTYASNDERGFYTGYFYINLFKNSTRWQSATIAATVKDQKSNGTTKQYKRNLNQDGGSNQTIRFQCSTCNNNIVIANGNTSTYYGSASYRLNNTCNDEGCKWHAYVSPPIKFKMPKGYKYSESRVGYNTYYVDGPAWMQLYNTNNYGQNNKTLFDSSVGKRGPYASDTWISGYINLSQWAMGSVTREGNLHSREYRSYQSYSIKFVPNTTTIKYNANGGSGSMSNQTKTYDAALTLRSNTFTNGTKVFKKWCTKADGTGTCYNAGQSLAAQIWPTPASTPTSSSTVTLYAQWSSSSTPPCEEWMGATYVSSSATNMGYNSGYFCIHYAKNGNVFYSDKISVTPKNKGTNGSSALYSAHLCSGASSCAQKWSFQPQKAVENDVGCGSEFDEYCASSKISAAGSAATVFAYVYPRIQIPVVKGYKYDTTQSLYGKIGLNSALFDQHELGLRGNVPSSGTAAAPLFSDVSLVGPYASDTSYNRYLSLNIWSAGLVNKKGKNNTYYAMHQSLNINYVPNETIIHYVGNGGTYDGSETSMSDSKVIYEDNSSILSANEYEKAGYDFIGWNTKADGTGVSFAPEQSVVTTFPTENEVTLYAQWVPSYNLKIYYQSNSSIGESNIDFVDLNCVGMDTMEYRIYGFYDQGRSKNFVVITDSNGYKMSGIPFQLINEASGEMLSLVTDSSGKALVDENFGSISDGWKLNFDSPIDINSSDVDVPYNQGYYDSSLISPDYTNVSNDYEYNTLNGYDRNKKLTSCTVTIPDEVKNSVGTYNNSYSGLADSVGTMTRSIGPSDDTITLDSNKDYFAVYSSGVTNYYYSN